MAHVHVADARVLQSRSEETRLAISHRDTAPSASLVLIELHTRIFEWNANGHSIGLDTSELDIDRMERSGEQSVYDIHGEKVVLLLCRDGKLCEGEQTTLLGLDRCWGANPSRTINRLFEKIGQPGARKITGEALSRMFWLAISDSIIRWHLRH